MSLRGYDVRLQYNAKIMLQGYSVTRSCYGGTDNSHSSQNPRCLRTILCSDYYYYYYYYYNCVGMLYY